MRNFCLLAKNLNVSGLLVELASQPELWNQFTVRTHHPQSAHRVVDDILLRYSAFNSGDDFVERVCSEVAVVTYPAWNKLPSAQQIVYALMTQVRGLHLGRVMVSRLAPGIGIPPHSDRIAPAEELFPAKRPPALYYERYHVCLQADPGVLFRCGSEQVQMNAGEVWWFNNQIEHEVVNNSRSDRLHLIIDIRTQHDDYVPH